MNKQFVEYIFTVDDELKDILIAELSEIGFEGFEEKENELVAFINDDAFNETELTAIINHHKISFSKQIIKEQNWNEVWESNFEPVIINDQVLIRAHFHQPIKNIPHEIIITPKMSFGTGHHATTHMMIEQMLSIDFTNKTVFDFGTGTGVLAIFAEQKNAASITAIDNDEWSINNATENVQQNNCTKIKLFLGDKPFTETGFDIVLANINKNIITDNFQNIVSALNTTATLLLSGLLVADESDILQLASTFNVKTHKNC